MVTVLIPCKNKAEWDIAVDQIAANMSGYSGNWATIPPGLKPDDPLPQMGYVGFRVEDDGNPVAELADKIKDILKD